MTGPRGKLIRLMRRLRSQEISAERFAHEYEHVWNFELTKDDVGPEESQIFERIFDVAVWYTPFLEDRVAYSGFKSEAAVTAAVERALEHLRE